MALKDTYYNLCGSLFLLCVTLCNQKNIIKDFKAYCQTEWQNI